MKARGEADECHIFCSSKRCKHSVEKGKHPVKTGSEPNRGKD